MDCPRCGISVFSDHSNCPSCGWQLSRPYVSGNPVGVGGGNGKPNGRRGEVTPAPIQTAADAFVLSPPRRKQQTVAQRRAGRRRRSIPDAGGVASLPPEARWETPPRLEVIEMPSVQSSFDFPTAELEANRLAGQAVAPVSMRLQAGLLDATLLLLAGGAFFGLFALLSGQVSLGRGDLLIYLLAGFALTALYFGLFTLFGGRTPGMQVYGLRPVTFDGGDLTSGHAVRRAFGYVVSAGSLLLGFLWALVDERRLTWHDIISHTFITHRSKL